MSKQTRYSMAFRQRALRRMKLGDNVSKLARELGVHRTCLYIWKRKMEKRRYRRVAEQEPERRGMSYTEESWIDDEATSHREPGE